MTERSYSMSDITRAADAPLALARREQNVDRALNLFVQGLIDALKALPATEHELRRLAAREEVLSMFDEPVER